MSQDASSSGVRLLPTRMIEKVWGRDRLPPPFAAPEGKRIGEIWFEPPAEMGDLLVKYLFTSEKLSVQVHPSIGNARPGEEGKEECWFVLDAEPGAQLAIGFDEDISAERMAQAARDGSIEDLLTWHDVAAGDVYYLPAGTVHAIGPGLSLVEVQQNSDTTFRLFDYGRPRALHLDRAVAVAHGKPYPQAHKGTAETRGQRLVDGPYFRLDRVTGAPNDELSSRYTGGVLALPLQGAVRAKRGDIIAHAGECLWAASLDALDFTQAEATLLTRSN